MNAWRRPEVWGLCTLVLAGLAWVAIDARRNPGDTRPSSAGIQDLRITRSTVVTDGRHRRLRVEFTATHSGPDALRVSSPGVRLLDAAEREVPVFFAPGAFPPALPPGPPAASWLEFWLTETQAAGPLTLEVGGQRVRLAAPATEG